LSINGIYNLRNVAARQGTSSEHLDIRLQLAGYFITKLFDMCCW
jgi:hypothetical protein